MNKAKQETIKITCCYQAELSINFDLFTQTSKLQTPNNC